MSGISLRPYQIDAVNRLRSGSILLGGTGVGKSRTALAYYYVKQGGKVNSDTYVKMCNPKDLYIITTAQKRDKYEWEGEMVPFLLSTSRKDVYSNTVVVDSWNNIKKYVNIRDAFFILDEQRLTGSGAWVKAFYKIARQNEWILLTATLADRWIECLPIFIANGFFRTKREFEDRHVVYKRFSKFPQIERYTDEMILRAYVSKIIVPMTSDRSTVQHHENIIVSHNMSKYREIGKTRWNPYKDRPIKNAGELCYTWRKLINSDESRATAVLEIFEKHPKVIIFYNFDYELEILRSIQFGDDVEVAEWNGHNHHPLPCGDKWVYLVQYTSGCEGWNCITTDTIIFYSANYSYKVMTQASGRIDRLNTPFLDLYYYHLKSRSPIDMAISRALNEKRSFNERAFVSI